MGGRVTCWADALPQQPALGPASRSDVLGPPSLPAPPPLRPSGGGGWRAAGAPGPQAGEARGGGTEPGAGKRGTMVLSVPVIALGATLGTATSILALCGVTCLCRHMHPKKGVLQRDLEPDPEKAKPSVLRAAQQVSGRGPRLPRGLGGGSPWRLRRGEWMGRNGWRSSLRDRARLGVGTADAFGQRMCSEALGRGRGVPKAWGVGGWRLGYRRKGASKPKVQAWE